MESFPVLSLITFLPLVGVLFILIVRGDEETVAKNARSAAMWASSVTFIVSLLLWFNFDTSTADFQFVEKHEWIPAFNISYHLGVDGISMFFVLLSTALTPLCVMASWKAIKTRVREYMIAFLVLETMMIGTFAALDFVLFYLFFEAGLIPMFLIIGVWGGERRVYSTFKFFLFTLLGSVLLLLAVIYMFQEAGTSDIPTLMTYEFGFEAQKWLWLAMFASFAVKMPTWPVHTYKLFKGIRE
jgi:NADH-quinone oxidoreductase subunit M